MRNDLAGFTREATMPKLAFKTEVMKQYNIKRVVLLIPESVFGGGDFHFQSCLCTYTRMVIRR